MSVKFVATQQPDGCETIMLLREEAGTIFRRAKSNIVPFSQWPKLAPPAGMSALALARSSDTGQINEDDEGITLPPEIVAALDEPDAHALGLPPVTALTLQLRSSGSLNEGTIAVEVKWVRRGGFPVRADTAGARTRESGRVGRIPEPIFSAFIAALAVNAADSPDERRAAFAVLRSQLGDDIGSGIDADGFIERIRIAYAANFSLDAKTDHGRFDFDPVLFSRQVEESGDGELVDQAESSLLTPSDTQHFQQRFRRQDGSRRSYLLSDGTLLFLDPLLGKALEVVRSRQAGTSQEKREFLRSPQRILREELQLDKTEDDGAADRLFIETQQFSERVSGIEIWQKPVLPWIKPKPNSWLPEGFGLRVGEPPDAKHIELAPGEAQTIADDVERAIECGSETIVWGAETIPATHATLQSARAIADLERKVKTDQEGRVDEYDEEEPLETFFLQIGENFEQLDYARLPRLEADATTFKMPQLPNGLISDPKQHQLEAFAWLTEAWQRKLPGLLLADDMGLGKTFQALMFLLWLRQVSTRPGPVLIVAPTGLLRNWQAEIAQHIAPGAMGSIIEAYGSNLAAYRQKLGNDIRGGTSRLDVHDWEDTGIVLTTYETMRDYHMSFARVPFSVIVYDEIQKLKNPASQMTRAAKTLNGRLQIAMTGTPVENRLQDLWSIADTVYPGFLGSSRDFEAAYPATEHDRLTALQEQLIKRDGAAPAFMLRRMKDEILSGLPEKKSEKYAVEMPPAQAQAYDLVLARARALRESGEQGAMLKVLHMLRGTSLHPEPPHGVDDIPAYIARSARLQKTFEILDAIQQRKEKVLLFCEDLEMQSFLAMAIQERFDLDSRPMCISGKIPGHKRQDIVNAFQISPGPFDVLILSPKAGGVGLTITAANNVIHLSRWWNPAVEDQATDRAYRIGQTRPVTIHIPIAVHPDPAIGPSSFDQRLDALMERKRALSRGLLMPPESDHDVDDLLSDVLDGRNTDGAEDGAVAPASEKIEVAGGESAEAEDTQAETLVGQDGTADAPTPFPGSDPVEPVPEESLPATPRPVLSVRTPVEAAEARTQSVHRVVYEQYGQRDWTIFEQFVRDARIDRLEIQDPYCCADEQARGRLLNFVNRFCDLAAKLGEVKIVTFDADSIDKRMPETNVSQRADLEERWRIVIGSTPLYLAQRSRRSRGDLHDRFVRAKLENGDAVIWDLGRGINGVMSAKWSCVVNAFYERSSAGRGLRGHRLQ